MQWLYPRSREQEFAWKLGAGVLGGALLISPIAMLTFDYGHYSFFRVSCLVTLVPFWRNSSLQAVCQWLRDFSIILESVCVLPQLLLLRQTTVPTVIDSFYLLTLGSYRAFYLLNWIWRGLDLNDIPPDAVSVIFGIIQTALYVDFAWVYYTRQRVKLRGGGIVDADDLRRGWLLNRIFGKHADVEPEDEEAQPSLGGAAGNGTAGGRAPRAKWGARGISVSADDTTLDQEGDVGSQEEGLTDGPMDPDAKMKDPDELARALDDDDEDGLPPAAPGGSSSDRPHNEWAD
jgi:hypothetical protein